MNFLLKKILEVMLLQEVQNKAKAAFLTHALNTPKSPSTLKHLNCDSMG